MSNTLHEDASRNDQHDEPYDNDASEIEETRCPLSLTLGEIMGDAFYPHITKNQSWGFDITIEGDDGEMVAAKIHPDSAWSLADFCRRFLKFYDNATKENA